jgi:hypothetical protein
VTWPMEKLRQAWTESIIVQHRKCSSLPCKHIASASNITHPNLYYRHFFSIRLKPFQTLNFCISEVRRPYSYFEPGLSITWRSRHYLSSQPRPYRLLRDTLICLFQPRRAPLQTQFVHFIDHCYGNQTSLQHTISENMQGGEQGMHFENIRRRQIQEEYRNLCRKG